MTHTLGYQTTTQGVTPSTLLMGWWMATHTHTHTHTHNTHTHTQRNKRKRRKEKKTKKKKKKTYSREKILYNQIVAT